MTKRKTQEKIRERGITLIALVITIIVLLILAGVAIFALTGDSGILSNAEKAKENTALANAKEQVEIAVQGALLDALSETGERKITYSNLEKELNNIVGAGKYEIVSEEGNLSWKVTIGDYEATIYENGEIVKARDTKTLPSATGTTPWLPTGFSQVSGTNLSNGLTITNKTGLQNYVWIEVPTTISASITRDGVATTVTLGDAQNDSEISEILHQYTGVYLGVYEAAEEWYDSNGKTAGTEGVDLKDDAGCGMTYNEYQTAYSNMLNSIKKYGGFWLAQYEAGIAYEQDGERSTHRTSESSRITNPTSANYAKDQYVYNYVHCSEAQKIANADSTKEYTSSLLFGVQFNLVCKFLEEKTGMNIDLNAWGNCLETFYTPSSTAKYSRDFGRTYTTARNEEGVLYSKTTEEEILLTTGAIEETTEGIDTNPMNIYDFAGNVIEYILYHSKSENYPCYIPGASYDTYFEWGGVCNNSSVSTVVADSTYGFRSTLY